MRLESLRAPGFQLPDLVAFNNRVHERIDPIFRRRWVRWLAIVFAAGFVLFAGMWIYFARTIPSSESLLAYQPAVFSRVADSIATRYPSSASG